MIRATAHRSSLARRPGLTAVISGVLCGSLLASLPAAARDGQLDKLVDAGVERQQTNKVFQQRIDQLDEDIQAKVRNYRDINKEIEGLEVYLAQLEQQVASQNTEMADLEGSIEQVTMIERQITPLMLKLIKGLDRFVALALPCLEENREKRVTRLENMMGRSDVSVAEKFRNVLQAYQTEIEYGRTIEAYRGPLATGEREREVDFLRVGRIAVLYQTLDGRETGLWNRQTESWETLPATYASQVDEGLRIAREQAAPSLLKLPLNTPQESL